MQAFLLILSLAVIVEALVQYAKTVIKMLENKQYKTFGTQLAAIFIAVFICFAAGADIFALMGISFSVHWLGTLLTGIVISRGSNYASDLIKRFQNPDIGERLFLRIFLVLRILQTKPRHALAVYLPTHDKRVRCKRCKPLHSHP